MFTLLGLVRGPSIGLTAAASLTGLPIPVTRRGRTLDATRLQHHIDNLRR